jgi:glutathione S-transferase
MSVPLLWHLKASHYNEKVRWALDYKGIEHARRHAPPGSHRAIARKLTGAPTFPVLVLDGRAIGDSTRIIAALERYRPEPALYPADPRERRRALELEDFFDEQLGPHARLLVFHRLLPEANAFLGMIDPDLTGARLAAARAVYPLVRRGVTTSFGADDAGARRALVTCRAAAERFRAELQTSGYLVGDSFTVADLTLAALLSPILTPPQFPYRQPQRDHPRLADVRAVLAEYGLGDWALEIYARHRSRAIMSS